MKQQSIITPDRDPSLHTFLPDAVSCQLASQQTIQLQLKTAITEAQLKALRQENASGFLLIYSAYLQDFTGITTLGDNNCAFNSIAIGIRDLLKLGRKIPENEGLLKTWNAMKGQSINWVQFCEHIKGLNTHDVQKTLAPVLRRYAQDMLMTEQKVALAEVKQDTPIETLQSHEFISNVIVEMKAYLCDQLQVKGYSIPKNPDTDAKKRFYSVTQEDKILRQAHKEKWDALLEAALKAQQLDEKAFLQLIDAPSGQGKVPYALDAFLAELCPEFLQYYKAEGHNKEWQLKKTANNGLLWEGNEMQGRVLRKLGIDFHFLHHPLKIACQSDCETDKGDPEAVGIIVAGFSGGHWTYYCDKRYLEVLEHKAAVIPPETDRGGTQRHNNSHETDVQIALWFLSIVAGLLIAIFATTPIINVIGIAALSAAYASQTFLMGLGSFVLFSLATRFSIWVAPKIIRGLSHLPQGLSKWCNTVPNRGYHHSSSRSTPSTSSTMGKVNKTAGSAGEPEANPSSSVIPQPGTGTVPTDMLKTEPAANPDGPGGTPPANL